MREAHSTQVYVLLQCRDVRAPLVRRVHDSLGNQVVLGGYAVVLCGVLLQSHTTQHLNQRSTGRLPLSSATRSAENTTAGLMDV